MASVCAKPLGFGSWYSDDARCPPDVEKELLADIIVGRDDYTDFVSKAMLKAARFEELWFDPEQLSIPQIVLIGGENVGKSTLVCRILGYDILARDSERCTRMVTTIMMKPGPYKQPVCRIYNRKTGESSEVFSMQPKDLRDKQEQAFADVESTIDQGIDADCEWQIQLQDPSLPYLTIKDTPGLIANTFSRNSDRVKSNTLAEQLVRDEGDDSKFIIVQDARSVSTTDIVSQFVGDNPACLNGVRVLTKTDLLSPREGEDIVARTQHSKGAEFKYGTILTASYGYTKQNGLNNVEKEEVGIFATAASVKSGKYKLDKSTCGMRAVRLCIFKMATDYKRELWAPTIFKAYNEEHDRLVAANRALGLPFLKANSASQKDMVPSDKATVQNAIHERALEIISECVGPQGDITSEWLMQEVLADLHRAVDKILLETAAVNEHSVHKRSTKAKELFDMLIAELDSPKLASLCSAQVQPPLDYIRRALENDDSPIAVGRFQQAIGQVMSTVKAYLALQKHHLAKALNTQRKTVGEDDYTVAFEIDVTTNEIKICIPLKRVFNSLLSQFVQNLTIVPEQCLPLVDEINIQDTTAAERDQIGRRLWLLDDAFEELSLLCVPSNHRVTSNYPALFISEQPGNAEEQHVPGVLAVARDTVKISTVGAVDEDEETEDYTQPDNTAPCSKEQAEALIAQNGCIECDGKLNNTVEVSLGELALLRCSSIVVRSVAGKEFDCVGVFGAIISSDGQEEWTTIFEAENTDAGASDVITIDVNTGDVFNKYRLVGSQGQPFSVSGVELYGRLLRFQTSEPRPEEEEEDDDAVVVAKAEAKAE